MAAEFNQSSDWKAYEPSAKAPWNRQRVVHLHHRAAFAASWPQIERDLADGPAAAVDRLLAGTARTEVAPADFDTMARTIGDAAQASSDPHRLQAWWFYRMLFSPDPLTERLALLWHNHFATSNRKVQDLVYMGQQNELFRKYAKAPFGELLSAVVKHPAILVWLDADSNRAGHANENLARELMELFTLGIGHYSETDVQGAARALTGWGVAGKTFRFISNRHDEDEISVLGQRQRLNGDELLAVLLEHPATARRLAWRLCMMFFGEAVVSDAAMDSLAAELHNRKLDIRWAVETILRSDVFYSSANLRARIPGPPEFIVGCVQALELCQPPPSTLLLAEWNNRMGQELFYPPNVGGWPEGRSWLGSRAVIARANFVSTLVAGGLWNSIQKPDIRKLAERHGKAGSLEQSIQWLCELMFGEVRTNVVEAALAVAHSKNEDDKLPAVLNAIMSRPDAQLA